MRRSFFKSDVMHELALNLYTLYSLRKSVNLKETLNEMLIAIFIKIHDLFFSCNFSFELVSIKSVSEFLCNALIFLLFQNLKKLFSRIYWKSMKSNLLKKQNFFKVGLLENSYFYLSFIPISTK